MKITKKRSLILLTAIMLAATLTICFALISGAQPNGDKILQSLIFGQHSHQVRSKVKC